MVKHHSKIFQCKKKVSGLETKVSIQTQVVVVYIKMYVVGHTI